MFTSKRVSFIVVLALLLGWGIISYFFLQAGQQLISLESDPLTPRVLPPGVKLHLEIDRSVYQPKDTILISLRNDSRNKITLSESADHCRQNWWTIELLGTDEQWKLVPLAAENCSSTPTGLSEFTKHTLRTDQWNGLVPAAALGAVFVPATTGTYRVAVPYQSGKVPDQNWVTPRQVVSRAFTIQ